jgi:hypothetical protein
MAFGRKNKATRFTGGSLLLSPNTPRKLPVSVPIFFLIAVLFLKIVQCHYHGLFITE